VNSVLSIGDFSRATHLSVKMLRFQHRSRPDLRCPRRLRDPAWACGRRADSRVLPRRPLRYPRRLVVANRNRMADLPNPAQAINNYVTLGTARSQQPGYLPAI